MDSPLHASGACGKLMFRVQRGRSLVRASTPPVHVDASEVHLIMDNNYLKIAHEGLDGG
jgi:hypothetical protein